VSCRSSATGEDGVDSSFAGQFDTQLNCIGLARVKQAILQVGYAPIPSYASNLPFVASCV
jgi:phosphoenolpyruvate synthase/pyruvate phosphate dikinase